MDIFVERLDAKLREWEPDTAKQVRQRIAERIDLADQEALDVMRSRAIEQEVLDLLLRETSMETLYPSSILPYLTQRDKAQRAHCSKRQPRNAIGS